MKKSYFCLTLLILGISFIISGVVNAFVMSYKDNKKKNIEEESVIADEIGSIYDKFYKMENDLSVKRTNLLKDISEYVSFYSNMSEKYDDMKNELDEYDVSLKEIGDFSSYLTSNCVNKVYSNADVNSKCISYLLNYEKTINTFVSDIEFLNSKIDEYNKWIEDEETSSKNKPLDKFSSSNFKEFVDLNGDGTYLGNNAD